MLDRKRFLAIAATVALVCGGCGSEDQNRARATANDAFIAAQVRARAAAIDAATMTLVHVSSKDGTVTLSGKVANAAERSSIETSARAVDGVRAVVNTIEVDPSVPTGEQIAADIELSARVRAALAAQTGVNAARVHLDVHRGVVTMTGTLPSRAHREVADQTARAVPGVKKLVDNIVIAK